MILFNSVFFFYFFTFCHEGLSFKPHELASKLNQTIVSTNDKPHVYCINLDKAFERKIIIQSILNNCGYNYTRIKALVPKDLFSEISLNVSTKRQRNLQVFKSCTISHLTAIYTAIKDYKLAIISGIPVQSIPHYALILEDDIRFLFDFNDWKGICMFIHVSICVYIYLYIYILI
jgi:GR25 family glycosyltransferase involved in LPS biosynthesis